MLDRSRSELTRIHQTIQKLLTYARTGEERPVEPGPFQVQPALQEAVGLARGHPALRRVELRVDDQFVDGDAHGHPGHFHQVMVNLLLNAGHADSKRFPIRSVQVQIAQRTTETLHVAVIDNGPGVPDDLKEVIFDPFYTTKGPGARAPAWALLSPVP